MTKTVIYHSADYDGIFCREIAKDFLGTDGVNYIGWNFGDDPLLIPEGPIYVLDLPIDRVFGFDFSKLADAPLRFSNINDISAILKCNTVWIDHHKSMVSP